MHHPMQEASTTYTTTILTINLVNNSYIDTILRYVGMACKLFKVGISQFGKYQEKNQSLNT
jgi:hypothetical protein